MGIESNIKTLPTVAISGGMDCVHVGHIRMIREAILHGRVIVILNSDEWLTRKKGKPFMCWEERAEILLNIQGVWGVMKVDDSDGTVCKALEELKPTYFANGGDRKEDNTPEVELCNKLGIGLLWNVGGDKIQSSSELIKNAHKA